MVSPVVAVFDGSGLNWTKSVDEWRETMISAAWLKTFTRYNGHEIYLSGDYVEASRVWRMLGKLVRA